MIEKQKSYNHLNYKYIDIYKSPWCKPLLFKECGRRAMTDDNDGAYLYYYLRWAKKAKRRKICWNGLEAFSVMKMLLLLFSLFFFVFFWKVTFFLVLEIIKVYEQCYLGFKCVRVSVRSGAEEYS